MKSIKFELTNDDRSHLGLEPVEISWERVSIPMRDESQMWLWFDGDTIRKRITLSDDSYLEEQLCAKTTDNRTILLPQTSKGKPKALNVSSIQSCSGLGVYFSASPEEARIANYTSQTTYCRMDLPAGDSFAGVLRQELDAWAANTTAADREEIERFRILAKQHYKYRGGDFFAFRISRREWGFGRILLDVGLRRKEPDYVAAENYGLDALMGKPLVVKVYHKIAATPEADLGELAGCSAFPSEFIMDNHFFYGEYPILGNLALQPGELEMPISYSDCSIWSDREKTYLQYGLICKTSSRIEFGKHLDSERESSPYRNNGLGFSPNVLLDLDIFRRCVAENTNKYWWESGFYVVKYNLHNPALREVKREIFAAFGLDADKDYAENLKFFRS